MKLNKEKIFRVGLIVFSLLISGVIIYFKDSLLELQNYGYLGIFVISIIGNATVIIPAPVALTALIGGGVFNPFVVGIVAALGATIGELTGYMAGYGGKSFVEKNKHYQKIEGWIKKRGFLTIFILAAIPNPLFDLAGICAGVTHYPIQRFLLATTLGKIIKFVTIALAGSYFF